MASRWREWAGDAHVDAHGHPPTEVNEFIPVNHEFDWNDIPNLLKNVYIPEDLVKMIKESNSSDVKKQMNGVRMGMSNRPFVRGRAEILKMRLKTRIPGSRTIKKPLKLKSLTNNKEPSVKRNAPIPKDFILDKQTLYFKHLPEDLTEKELIESISQFGKVSNCEISPVMSESMTLVRLEEASACDWVISFYRGMPYDDGCIPLECDYVLEIAETLK